MFEGAVGVGVVILFLRMARLDEENPALWSILAGLAWFVPMFLLGPFAPYGCTGLLFAAYFAWKMLRDPKGGKVR